MSIEQYSVLLSTSVMLLATAVVLSSLGYFYFDSVKAKLLGFTYFTYLKIIACIATLATLGALTYQFAFDVPVCSLCWAQRIFMFPLEIIIIVTLFYKSRINHVVTGTLAVIGLFFSSYHYYTHVQKYVLKTAETLPVPCTTSTFTESCLHSPILTFGFITIPFMALVAFVAIIWLSFLASKRIGND